MTLPFSLKVGHISLEISPSEQITTHDSTDNDIWKEIPNSWRTLKELVEIYIDGYESGHSHDPFRSNPKVKLMMEIFNALSNSPIEEKTLIKELLKTGHFSEDEAKSYIKPAVIHGMFKEDTDGLYIRA